MANDNELVTYARENNLEETRVNALLADFGGPFQEAQKLILDIHKLKVTSEDQTEQMATARQCRLQLKEIRVEAEHIRKRVKEQALREGKAIDGMANIIKAMIVPAEEFLEQQEKFSENMATERRRVRIQERSMKLLQYMSESSLQAYNYADLTEEDFGDLLVNVKAAYDKRIADEKAAAEADRLAAEQAEKERREREEADQKARIEAEKQAAVERERREAAEAEAARQRKIADEKLAKERAAREKLEREAQEREKAAAVEKRRLEEEEAERLETERRAAAAPDKDKLMALVNELEIPIEIQLDTEKAREILGRINRHRAEAVDKYREIISKL
jgi:hypothetical protein